MCDLWQRLHWMEGSGKRGRDTRWEVVDSEDVGRLTAWRAEARSVAVE